MITAEALRLMWTKERGDDLLDWVSYFRCCGAGKALVLEKKGTRTPMIVPVTLVMMSKIEGKRLWQ